ncbi:TPA: F-box protein [Legionella pneumophila]
MKGKSEIKVDKKSKQPFVYLLELPEEILMSIFEYLTPDALGRLRACNKSLKKLCDNQTLWDNSFGAVNYSKKLKCSKFKEESVFSSHHIFNASNGFVTRLNKDKNEFTFWQSNALPLKSKKFEIPQVKYKESMEYFSDIACINKNYCIVNANTSTLYPRNIILFDNEAKKIIAVYGGKYPLQVENVIYSENVLHGEHPIAVATRSPEDKYIFIADSYFNYSNITVFDGNKFQHFFQERESTKDNLWGYLKFKNVDAPTTSQKFKEKAGEIVDLLFTSDKKLITISSKGYLIIRNIIENTNELCISKEGYLEQLPGSFCKRVDYEIHKAILLKNQNIACGAKDGVLYIYSKDQFGKYSQIKQIDCKPKKESFESNNFWSCLQMAPSGDIIAGLDVANELLIIDGKDLSIKNKLTYEDRITKAFVLNTGAIVALTDSNQISITSFSYNHEEKRSNCSIM